MSGGRVRAGVPAYTVTTTVALTTALALAAARPVTDRHLRVHLPAPPPWPQLADVLVAEGRGHAAAEELSARHPAALVTAVHEGTQCWLRLRLRRSGTDCTAHLVTPHAPHGQHAPHGRHARDAIPPWLLWPVGASLAHTWLVAGLP